MALEWLRMASKALGRVHNEGQNGDPSVQCKLMMLSSGSFIVSKPEDVTGEIDLWQTEYTDIYGGIPGSFPFTILDIYFEGESHCRESLLGDTGKSWCNVLAAAQIPGVGQNMGVTGQTCSGTDGEGYCEHNDDDNPCPPGFTTAGQATMGAQLSAATAQDAEGWSTDDVAGYLAALGEAFAGYGPAVAANGIDGAVLLTLTEEDLEALGVDNAFHKRRLVSEICKLKNRGSQVLPTAALQGPPVVLAKGPLVPKKNKVQPVTNDVSALKASMEQGVSAASKLPPATTAEDERKSPQTTPKDQSLLKNKVQPLTHDVMDGSNAPASAGNLAEQIDTIKAQIQKVKAEIDRGLYDNVAMLKGLSEQLEQAEAAQAEQAAQAGQELQDQQMLKEQIEAIETQIQKIKAEIDRELYNNVAMLKGLSEQLEQKKAAARMMEQKRERQRQIEGIKAEIENGVYDNAHVLKALASGTKTVSVTKNNPQQDSLGCLDVDRIRDANSIISVVLLVAIAIKIGVFDSIVSFRKPIRGAFEYIFTLVGLMYYFPYLCAALMGFLIDSIGKTQDALVVVLIIWSAFLTVVYLLSRTIAERAMPVSAYEKVPIVIFPFQIIGDLFAEMVLVDFRLDDWGFWLVLLFDIFLLIMRDADLWTDFAALVQRKSGSFGSFLLSMGLLISGDADELGDSLYGASSKEIQLRERVKRELTEMSC
eukprot:g1011.t1